MNDLDWKKGMGRTGVTEFTSGKGSLSSGVEEIIRTVIVHLTDAN